MILGRVHQQRADQGQHDLSAVGMASKNRWQFVGQVGNQVGEWVKIIGIPPARRICPSEVLMSSCPEKGVTARKCILRTVGANER